MISSLLRTLLRISGFVAKELAQVFRQTPLMLSLVLGPFLILLLFGIGFRDNSRPLGALFVVPEDPDLRSQVDSLVSDFGPALVYEGVTHDSEAALRSLQNKEVDLVVVVPPDADQIIRDNEQIVIGLYHNEIDPFQIAYIESVGRLYVDELNRGVLRYLAGQGQVEVSEILPKVRAAREMVRDLQAAVGGGASPGISDESQALNDELDSIALLLAGNLALMSGLGDFLGGAEESASSGAIEEIISDLDRAQEDFNAGADPGSAGADLDSLERMDGRLANLESRLAEVQGTEPYVLVAPFRSEVKSSSGVALTPANYFAPAVVVLLLQHLAVTFAAMAIVREQGSGSMELFRVSPLGSLEILGGKYLSYLLLVGVVAAAITAAAVFVLGVPMLGAWQDYVVVVLALVFTSLGMGFLISLLAKTDLQAFQYAMFLLLGSIFFTGFFLDLRYLWEPVRLVSRFLPATYGIRLLQDVALRGSSIDPLLVSLLAGAGIALCLLAWFILRRRLEQE